MENEEQGTQGVNALGLQQQPKQIQVPERIEDVDVTIQWLNSVINYYNLMTQEVKKLKEQLSEKDKIIRKYEEQKDLEQMG